MLVLRKVPLVDVDYCPYVVPSCKTLTFVVPEVYNTEIGSGLSGTQWRRCKLTNTPHVNMARWNNRENRLGGCCAFRFPWGTCETIVNAILEAAFPELEFKFTQSTGQMLVSSSSSAVVDALVCVPVVVSDSISSCSSV